jgi:hypothetical protein
MSDETQPTESLGSDPVPAEPAPTPTVTLPATTLGIPTTPRIRWGGVIWGALFCAFGVVVMVVLSSDSNRQGFTAWFDGLGPAGAGITAIIALGVLVLILGILGLAGRAQRPR